MKVNFDDIEIGNVDAGGGNMYYYNDKPFSGTIVEYNAEGVLIGEISVINGHTVGRVASYYDNGQIEEEYYEKFNAMYGFYRKWKDSGDLLIEHDYGPEPS